MSKFLYNVYITHRHTRSSDNCYLGIIPSATKCSNIRKRSPPPANLSFLKTDVRKMASVYMMELAKKPIMNSEDGHPTYRLTTPKKSMIRVAAQDMITRNMNKRSRSDCARSCAVVLPLIPHLPMHFCCFL